MSEEIKLKISCDRLGEIQAEFVEKNPETKAAILNALPFEGAANVWGDEIYFNIPAVVAEENTQQEMDDGDIAFWPMGSAMCIFFGPTPVSDSEKPKAYSPVNMFAKIIGDPKIFKKVKDGDIIRVQKSD